MQVTIIGAGVIGLTTAVYLQQQGFAVKVYAEQMPWDTTSAVAAAIWFPYLAEPLDKVNQWSRESFQRYETLAENPKTGVSLERFLILSTPEQAAPWLNAVPPERIAAAPNASLPVGYDYGYELTVPLIQSQIYLPWLFETFLGAGGKIRQRRITSLEALCAETDMVINCSGLGAKKLCSDEAVYPVRGQIVQVQTDASIPNFGDDDGPNRLAYIVNRDDGVILGGTAQRNNYDRRADPDDTAGILHRCNNLAPQLSGAQISKVLVGLRPGRTSVRVERDPELPVIHNYGHGGSGYTVAWGCAHEVAELI